MTTVEALHFSAESQRAATALLALESAGSRIGLRVRRTTTYRGGAEILLLWGPGAPDRFEPMRRQIAAGGHVVALDLSYWDRERKFRIAFDAAHPQAWVMRRALSPSRLEADGIKSATVWDANGPVVVAGIGEKAGVQYGMDAVRRWELDMIARARADGRRVLYRPKRSGQLTPDVPLAGGGTIDRALGGAAVVITWHSNVAVDAIRLGIPAICRDGAAAAICPSDWTATPTPLTPAQRDQFLANLSWFQWAPTEAQACWSFITEALA